MSDEFLPVPPVGPGPFHRPRASVDDSLGQEVHEGSSSFSFRTDPPVLTAGSPRRHRGRPNTQRAVSDAEAMADEVFGDVDPDTVAARCVDGSVDTDKLGQFAARLFHILAGLKDAGSSSGSRRRRLSRRSDVDSCRAHDDEVPALSENESLSGGPAQFNATATFQEGDPTTPSPPRYEPPAVFGGPSPPATSTTLKSPPRSRHLGTPGGEDTRAPRPPLSPLDRDGNHLLPVSTMPGRLSLSTGASASNSTATLDSMAVRTDDVVPSPATTTAKPAATAPASQRDSAGPASPMAKTPSPVEDCHPGPVIRNHTFPHDPNSSPPADIFQADKRTDQCDSGSVTPRDRAKSVTVIEPEPASLPSTPSMKLRKVSPSAVSSRSTHLMCEVPSQGNSPQSPPQDARRTAASPRMSPNTRSPRAGFTANGVPPPLISSLHDVEGMSVDGTTPGVSFCDAGAAAMLTNNSRGSSMRRAEFGSAHCIAAPMVTVTGGSNSSSTAARSFTRRRRKSDDRSIDSAITALGHNQFSSVFVQETPCDEMVATICDLFLSEVIGQGSHGKVYRAVHMTEGTEYAVKEITLRPEDRCARSASPGEDGPAEDAALLDLQQDVQQLPLRVRREVALLKILSHENVMRLYEAIDDRANNRVLLRMDLLSCPIGFCDAHGNLTGGRLDETQAARLFRQAASGLAYLHQHCIVHHDIKPENLLLDGDDISTARLTITDFGLSQEHDPRTTRLSYTAGTPAYTPPEATEPDSPDSSSSGGHALELAKAGDVWALGVTFLTLLSGHHPFVEEGMDREALFNAIRTKFILIPQTLSREWCEVLKGMLERNPHRRMSLTQVRNSSLIKRNRVVHDRTTPFLGPAVSAPSSIPILSLEEPDRAVPATASTHVTQEEVDNAFSVARSGAASPNGLRSLAASPTRRGNAASPALSRHRSQQFPLPRHGPSRGRRGMGMGKLVHVSASEVDLTALDDEC